MTFETVPVTFGRHAGTWQTTPGAHRHNGLYKQFGPPNQNLVCTEKHGAA